MLRCVIVLVSLALVSCGGEAVEPDASSDGGRDAGAPEACGSDVDCDDGEYCNGDETCAGDRCAPGTPPCDGGETCDEATDACDEGCAAPDADEDGHRAAVCGGDDCDDDDANRYPGNAEVCDASDHDEDCDATTFGIRDADGDLFPDAACCNVDADDELRCGSDCDDTLAIVHPTAPETCEGLDNDCDGATDEGVVTTFVEDADGDGYGSDDAAAARMTACFRPTGYAETADDCDDGSTGFNPVLEEVCDGAEPPVDENCDGEANPAVLCTCTAGMTRMCARPGVCATGTESCNGATGTWLPCSVMGTGETCNTQDDDCDGPVDEGTTVTCYDDGDNDGFALGGAMVRQPCPDPTRTSVGLCPLGMTNLAPASPNLDCDDLSAMRAPGRGETCNLVDEDCDSRVDEGTTVTCYPDADEDRYPADAASSDRCPDSARSFVGGCPTNTTNRVPADGIDCDEGSSAINPAAAEECEGSVDENCDGMIDPAADCACTNGEARMCPRAGACAAGTENCIEGDWGTCSIAATSETCNLADDDCDGLTDEGTTVPCYTDVDNDRYAESGAPLRSLCPDLSRTSVGTCPLGATNIAPTGASIDCDDEDPSRAPFRGEDCNGADDDCDAVTDEGVTVTCYTDMDEDRYPAGGATGTPRCPDPGRTFVSGCPVNTTNRDPADDVDCQDVDPAINPAASEICEGSVDENCDGLVDPPADCDCMNGTTRACPEPGVCGSLGIQSCTGGMWGACSRTPMSESCNGLDDDCDDDTDETFTCAVGANQQCSVCGRPVSEGSRSCQGSCTWGACTAANELCNGCDDDGNGQLDEAFLCRQGQAGLPCTTACGTSGGTGTCNATCDGYDMCFRGTEVCNYCDDTGDGTFDDEAPIATNTRQWTPTCASVDHGLTQCETGAGSGAAFYEESRLLDGTTNLGGWFNRVLWNAQPRLGHGEMHFHSTVFVRRTITGNPVDGWALIVARSGYLNLIGEADSLAYDRAPLHGFAIEWRWTPGGSATDRITFRELNGTAAGGASFSANAPVANRLESGTATTTTITQPLHIYYTPENSSTGTVEERLELRTTPRSAGATGALFTVYSRSFSGCITANCGLSDAIPPGTPMIIATSGMTGPSYGSHTRVRAWWSMGIDFSTSPYQTQLTTSNTCP